MGVAGLNVAEDVHVLGQFSPHFGDVADNGRVSYRVLAAALSYRCQDAPPRRYDRSNISAEDNQPFVRSHLGSGFSGPGQDGSENTCLKTVVERIPQVRSDLKR